MFPAAAARADADEAVPAFNFAVGGVGTTSSLASGTGTITGLSLGGISASAYRRVYAFLAMDFSADTDDVAIDTGTIGGETASVVESGGEGFVATAVLSAIVPSGTTASVTFDPSVGTNFLSARCRLIVLEGALAKTAVSDAVGDYVNGNPQPDIPNPGFGAGVGCSEGGTGTPNGTVVDERVALPGATGQMSVAYTVDTGTTFNFAFPTGGGDECGSAFSVDESA